MTFSNRLFYDKAGPPAAQAFLPAVSKPYRLIGVLACRALSKQEHHFLGMSECALVGYVAFRRAERHDLHFIHYQLNFGAGHISMEGQFWLWPRAARQAVLPECRRWDAAPQY